MTIAPEHPSPALGPVDPNGTTSVGRRGVLTRIGRIGRRSLDPVEASRRRWLLHVLALAAVLGGILLYVGATQIVSADEGAALVQANVLTRTGQWAMPATSALDPTGAWFPIHLSHPVGDRMYPFSRPPLYPLIIQPLLNHGGLPAVLVLHVLALLLTGLLAGLLAERLRPGRGIQAMWVTAVLSPLLFDGYWVIAHSLVAAGVTAAALGAVRVGIDGRIRWLPVWFVGLASAVLLRSEPLIFAVGLAAGLAVVALFARGWRRLHALVLGSATLGVAALGYWISTVWRQAVESGSKTPGYVPDTAGGVVAGRIKGFEHSVLGPGTVGRLGPLLVVVTLGLVVVALVATRFDLGTPRLRRAAAWAAVATAILRVVLPIDLITGLLLAAPVLIVAALCVPWERLREQPVRLVAVTAVLTVLGVAASEHDTGGAGEWGGRYFHVALPLICVLAVVTFDWLIAHRGAVGRSVVTAGLLVCLAYGVLAMRESREARIAGSVTTETAWRTARTTRSAHQPGGPVVVSTWVAGGRFSWRHVLDGRYLTVSERRDLPELGRRLRHAGVPDFTVLAQPGDGAHLDEVGSGYRVTRTIHLGTQGWTVEVLASA